MSDKSIIFDCQHIRAIWQPSQSDAIVVAFNEFATRTDGDRFWGETLFAKERISAIGVMTPEPNWYPREDMSAVARAILAVAGDRPVFTYGFSQGAYGAIKWSAALNARSVLAFCPQSAITPDVVSAFDTRHIRWYREALRNGEAIKREEVAGRVVVVLDPRESRDVQHAARIAEQIEFETVICPFTGHGAIRLPPQAGLSGEMIRAFIEEAPNFPAQLRDLLRRARRRSATYADFAIQQLVSKRKNALAERLIERLSIPNKNEKIASIALHSDNPDTVKTAIAQLNADQMERIGLLTCWTACRKNRLPDEERVAAAIMERARNNGFASLHALNSLIHFGRRDEAENELRRLVAHFDAKPWKDHIRYFAAALGAADIERLAASWL